MAEQVQAALDAMVAPLRDLAERQIFSDIEIKAIVARRRESEYLLRRRAARKSDFLRYIEAEEMLEELRSLRTEQRKRDHRNAQGKVAASIEATSDELGEKKENDDENVEGQGKKVEKHIGDTHIIQLIHLLFVRVIRKFRSDLSLHLLHVDFCKKHQSWTKLSKVYAEALQFFPKQAGLWIESASHEFFGPRRSIRNARILLQRALRLLPSSQDLWVEYFSLELHYAQTLRGRRQILIKGGGRFEEEHVLEEDTEKEENDETVDKYYKIALIVYTNAIKTISDSVNFLIRFLNTCRHFPETEKLMDRIKEDIQKNFGSEPDAWIARAIYEAEKIQNNALTQMDEAADASGQSHAKNSKTAIRPKKKAKTKDQVIAILEDAVETVDTPLMDLHAFRFAIKYSKEQQELGNRSSALQAQDFVDMVIERSSGQSTSVDLAREQAEYYCASNQTKKAIKVLADFCTQNDSPASMWIRWAALCSSAKETKGIFEIALKQIPMSQSDHFVVLLQYFGCLMSEDMVLNESLLFDTLRKIILLAPTTWDINVDGVEQYTFGVQGVLQAYLRYLQFVRKHFGSVAARKVYETILFQSSIPNMSAHNQLQQETMKAFVEACLDLESSSQDRKFRRRLCEKATNIFKNTSVEGYFRQKRLETLL